MEFEFTLNENDKKILSAYIILALKAFQTSANKDTKLIDVDPEELEKEVLVMCDIYSITTALDISRKYKEEWKKSKGKV